MIDEAILLQQVLEYRAVTYMTDNYPSCILVRYITSSRNNPYYLLPVAYRLGLLSLGCWFGFYKTHIPLSSRPDAVTFPRLLMNCAADVKRFSISLLSERNVLHCLQRERERASEGVARFAFPAPAPPSSYVTSCYSVPICLWVSPEQESVLGIDTG